MFLLINAKRVKYFMTKPIKLVKLSIAIVCDYINVEVSNNHKKLPKNCLGSIHIPSRRKLSIKVSQKTLKAKWHKGELISSQQHQKQEKKKGESNLLYSSFLILTKTNDIFNFSCIKVQLPSCFSVSDFLISVLSHPCHCPLN